MTKENDKKISDMRDKIDGMQRRVDEALEPVEGEKGSEKKLSDIIAQGQKVYRERNVIPSLDGASPIPIIPRTTPRDVTREDRILDTPVKYKHLVWVLVGVIIYNMLILGVVLL